MTKTKNDENQNDFFMAGYCNERIVAMSR